CRRRSAMAEAAALSGGRAASPATLPPLRQPGGLGQAVRHIAGDAILAQSLELGLASGVVVALCAATQFGLAIVPAGAQILPCRQRFGRAPRSEDGWGCIQQLS